MNEEETILKIVPLIEELTSIVNQLTNRVIALEEKNK